MNKLNDLSDAGFWEILNPDLSITPTPFADRAKDFEFGNAEIDGYVQQVKDEGYFQTLPVINTNEVSPLADAVKKIVNLNLPPVFIFVYDEIWQYFARLSKILNPILGQKNTIKLAGMWAWHINKNDSGFAPHRDMKMIKNQVDGRPSNLTIWIPFTDATPLNGCMYVYPTNLDPNHPDNLQIMQLGDIRDIRALPAAAGSILAWDASILHWGSRCSQRAEQPRISIAMDFSTNNPEYETDDSTCYSKGPVLDVNQCVELSFQSRLNAIGEAIWGFKQRVIVLYPEQADMLLSFCGKHSISPEQQTEVSQQASYWIMKRDVHELIGKKKYNEALPILQDICDLHMDDRQAHKDLANVLLMLNKNDQAISAIRRALSVFPNNMALRELLIKAERK